MVRGFSKMGDLEVTPFQGRVWFGVFSGADRLKILIIQIDRVFLGFWVLVG